MGASVPRTLAAIVFLLAFAGAQADLTDVNKKCAGDLEDIPKFTRSYCVISDRANQTIGTFLRHSHIMGGFFVISHHVLSTMKTVAEQNNDFEDIGISGRMRLEELARILRLLGQNMWVYMCYYADKEHMKIPKFLRDQPFMHSLALIMLDVVVLWSIRGVIETFIVRRQANRTHSGDLQAVFDGLTSEEDKGNCVWDLGTIYTLPTVPPLRFVLTWLSQTVLFCYYVLVMNQISIALEKNLNEGSTFMWLVGVIIMATMGENESGESFAFAAWWEIWTAWYKAGMYKKPFLTLHVGFRFLSDWSVNSIYRQILLATTPILLSTEEPLDFIKDVLAIMFISTMDDPSDDIEDTAKKAFYDYANKIRGADGSSTPSQDEPTDQPNRGADGSSSSGSSAPSQDEVLEGMSTSESAEYMLGMMDAEPTPALGVCVVWKLLHKWFCKWLRPPCECCGLCALEENRADAREEPLMDNDYGQR